MAVAARGAIHARSQARPRLDHRRRLRLAQAVTAVAVVAPIQLSALCVGKGGAGGVLNTNGVSGAYCGQPGLGGVAETGDVITLGSPGEKGPLSTTIVTTAVSVGRGGASHFGDGGTFCRSPGSPATPEIRGVQAAPAQP